MKKVALIVCSGVLFFISVESYAETKCAWIFSGDGQKVCLPYKSQKNGSSNREKLILPPELQRSPAELEEFADKANSEST